jgi:hypothetical protein
MSRNLARHLKQVDHRRASAHDTVKFKILDQTLLQVTNPSPTIELLGKLLDGFL